MTAHASGCRRRPTALLGLAGLLLSGCGLLGGVHDTPLPGGADLGEDPIEVTAEFEDVLDLVPQSSVKVDNVPVGRVTEISLSEDGSKAEVGLLIRSDLGLPNTVTARLQQTSLLGEKYVALVRPTLGGFGVDDAGVGTAQTTGGTGKLEDGAVLTTEGTDAAATVEQVLGSLSLVLNGGGIGQFQEISKELQQVGAGRTEELRVFLQELSTFVGVLNEKRDAITTAIDGLAALGKSLDQDREKIASVLEGLSPGLQVLVDQRPQFTAMLTALDKLSKVTVRTLAASQKDLVADFKALDPILSELAKAGTDLPYSLEILLTYPFPDSVLNAIRGDYLNVFIVTNFRSVPTNCAAIECAWPQPVSALRSSGRVVVPDVPPLLPPTDSAAPGVPSPSVPGPSIGPSVGPSDSPSGSPTQSPSPGDSPSSSESTSPQGSSPSKSASPEGGQ